MEDDRAKDFFNKNPKNSFEELIEKEKESNSEFLTIEEYSKKQAIKETQ